jgi:hypothetical protein
MPTTSTLLRFRSDPVRFVGGARYATGRDYVLDRFETALWLRRGVVDTESMVEGIDLTDEVIAKSEANKRPGRSLSLQEIIYALAHEKTR